MQTSSQERERDKRGEMGGKRRTFSRRGKKRRTLFGKEIESNDTPEHLSRQKKLGRKKKKTKKITES